MYAEQSKFKLRGLETLSRKSSLDGDIHKCDSHVAVEAISYSELSAWKFDDRSVFRRERTKTTAGQGTQPTAANAATLAKKETTGQLAC